MLDRIRSFTLFQSAPESFLAAIGSHLRPQLHSPHDYILTEGDEAKAMYWLVRGAVAVTSRDGESTYAELKPGAFFGEIGLLMNIPRTATIIARTKCLLVVLKKEDFVKELPNYPDVERAIREEAQERLSILERKKKEMKPYIADEAGALAGRREKRPRESEDGDTIMSNSAISRENGSTNNKKRKSPSPSLVEVAASSALGSGLVNVRQLLKELPLFATLPPEMLHFLGSNARQCTFPPFTDIIKQDSQGREAYFIVRGEVEVIDERALGHDGRPFSNGVGPNYTRGLQVKARLRQGQYFGEVASLSLAPRRTATVRSISFVECLLITGEVLAEFWLRCPATIREQIEKTAKQRLRSRSDKDVVMSESSDATPPIDELAIGERRPRSPRTPSFPNPTIQYPKLESPHKPSRLEDRAISEPFDPDPYLGIELDIMRSRSRRSSLAPVPVEGTQESDRKTGAKQPAPPKPKHVITPPDPFLHTKRPKVIARRPSHLSRGLFPDKVLVRIFSHLELHCLMRLQVISTYWSKLLRESPALCHDLDLASYNRRVTDEALKLRICPFVGARPRSIDISNCFHMTDDGFTALATQCGANVLRWKMKSVWDVTAQAILDMVKSAKGLEEVDLSNCRKVNDHLLMYLIGTVPQAPSPPILNARGYATRQVGPRTGPPTTINTHAPAVIIGSQKLRKLTLSYCKHVTDRSMNHIGNYARGKLEEIDLTRCTTITDHGFQAWGQHQFSKLTKLCLADCTYLTDNAIVYLTNAAKGLRELDLVSPVSPS